MSGTPTTRVRTMIQITKPEKAEGKQQLQLETTNTQYKAPAARPAANHNNDLARSSDIAGEVTLKNDRGRVLAIKDELSSSKMLQPGGQGCPRPIDSISTSIRKQQKQHPKCRSTQLHCR